MANTDELSDDYKRLEAAVMAQLKTGLNHEELTKVYRQRLVDLAASYHGSTDTFIAITNCLVCIQVCGNLKRAQHDTGPKTSKDG